MGVEHLGPSEIQYPPSWVELTPAHFPELSMPGTIGEHFLQKHAQILTARKRPATIFNQPVEDLWRHPRSRSSALKTALTLGLTRVSDLMQMKTNFNIDILIMLDRYFTNLAVTPHARFLEIMYVQLTQDPVPAKLEPELIHAVEDSLAQSNLTPKERLAMDLRFGLQDGIIKPREKVPRGLLFTDRVREKIMRFSPRLQGYIVLPEKSFGRKHLGVIFRKDLSLPERFFITPSDPIWDELRRKDITINDCLQKDDYYLELVGLSQTARDKIEKALLNALRKEKDVLE